MPETTYNDNSCCENATETLEGKDIFAETTENSGEKSQYISNEFA